MTGQDLSGGAAAVAEALPTLSEVQDVNVNYYVLVPFTTADAAKWAARAVGAMLDCHVVGASAVAQSALVIATELSGRA